MMLTSIPWLFFKNKKFNCFVLICFVSSFVGGGGFDLVGIFFPSPKVPQLP